MNFGAGINLLLPFGVTAQRSAAPLPVGETGGSKGKGGGQGGGITHPSGRLSRAVLAPPEVIRGKDGENPGRRAGKARDPFRAARGGAP